MEDQNLVLAETPILYVLWLRPMGLSFRSALVARCGQTLLSDATILPSWSATGATAG